MNLPYRWVRNLVQLQEKRPYHFTTVAAFAGFVGAVRLLEEWALGHCSIQDYLARLNLNFSFYLLCFFSYTAAMRPLVGPPWRKTINVILIGVFCGMLPPLVDVVFNGLQGQCYAYVHLSDWSLGIYDPAQRMSIGEAGVLWFTIALCGTYVWVKTASIARAVAGLVAGYLAVLLNASLLFTAAMWLVPAMGGSPAGFHLTAIQLTACLGLYLALQPRLAAGLAKRANHALPFGLIFLVGAAFAEGLTASVFLQSGLALFGFVVAIAQNDLYDADDDAPQGRKPYLDRHDVAALDAIFLAFALNAVQYRSALGAAMIIFWIASFLYNHPSYRAKAYFPSNLKIEGVWGVSACLMGVAAALESGVAAREGRLQQIREPALAEGFDWPTVIMLLLVFGGWSVVAALKDYKDVRADRSAGVQTLYTLVFKGGWGLRRLHRWLTLTVAVGLSLPFGLAAAIGRVHPATTLLGIVAGVVVFALMSGPPSSRRFEGVLGVLSAYLGVWVLLLI